MDPATVTILLRMTDIAFAAMSLYANSRDAGDEARSLLQDVDDIKQRIHAGETPEDLEPEITAIKASLMREMDAAIARL